MPVITHTQARAFVAYLASNSDAPSTLNIEDVSDDNGLQYVVLRDTKGELLAVYRVRTEAANGVLRRLKRWPSEVVAE